MKVLELMERAGTRDTNLVVAWIKDAIHTIESAQNKPLNLRTKKLTITKNSRDYDLPTDLISIRNIRRDAMDKIVNKIIIVETNKKSFLINSDN